jgi:hypothetical protein
MVLRKTCSPAEHEALVGPMADAWRERQCLQSRQCLGGSCSSYGGQQSSHNISEDLDKTLKIGVKELMYTALCRFAQTELSLKLLNNADAGEQCGSEFLILALFSAAFRGWPGLRRRRR